MWVICDANVSRKQRVAQIFHSAKSKQEIIKSKNGLCTTVHIQWIRNAHTHNIFNIRWMWYIVCAWCFWCFVFIVACWSVCQIYYWRSHIEMRATEARIFALMDEFRINDMSSQRARERGLGNEKKLQQWPEWATMA